MVVGCLFRVGAVGALFRDPETFPSSLYQFFHSSARSVDVAKRLHDTETKKALLAMRLQRELRMKPHEAVAVAKSLLAQPAVSRMDLESINLRSLLSDHAEAVKVVCVVCLFSRKFAFIAGFFCDVHSRPKPNP
jgi:hypothetical protein